MSAENMIEVDGLGKCYHIYDRPQDRLKQSLWGARRKFYREFWALRDVSFQVAPGETVGIIGVNGSGKSTLLQLIAGTLAPTTGTSRVGGRVAALLELGSGFNPEFTGRENVFMNGAILGLSHEQISERFDAIAAFADIGDFIEQPVKTYSSGMLVRLAFAVAINVEPDIMIIDEALAVGDMGFQLKCMERLEQITKSGATLLFVSHDMSAIKAFCNRAIYLSGGVVKAAGAAADVVEIYLLDIREAQRRGAAATQAYKLKPAIGREGAIAFGTDQGRIVSASFAESGGSQWACSTGDVVNIVVDVEYDGSVKGPSLSLVVFDRRMVDLTGRYLMLDASPDGDGLHRARVRFSFAAMMNTGTFLFTLRLEDRASDNIFLPIDKQAGILQLHVNRPPSRPFLGWIETPIQCSIER